MKKIAGILLTFLFLLACATAERGQRFDTTQASQIEIGKTTEAEVLASLGQPYRSQIRANGEKVFVYSHVLAKGSLIGTTAKAEKLAILFDKNGVVKAIDKAGI